MAWKSTSPEGNSLNLNNGRPDNLRRNYALGVASGIAYNLYIVVLSTELVLTWFLTDLTSSNLLISLLVPIELGTWYLMQFVLSGPLRHMPRSMPLYRATALIRLVVAGILAAAVFVLDASPALLIVFLATFSINSLAGGVAALPFLNIVAKTVPVALRGIYFGWRRFGGALLGLMGGLLVAYVLAPDSGLGFPQGYGVLFVLGFCSLFVQVGAFSLVVEPAEAVDAQPVRFGEQLRRSVRLPFEDRNFARFLAFSVATVVARYALPFYAVFARRMLDAPDNMAGAYVIALTLAGALSNLVVGLIGDKRGNRLVLRLAALTSILPPFVALLIASLPGPAVDKSMVFTLVFLLQGFHTTADSIGRLTYLMELSSTIDRVVYIGVANGVFGLALLTLPLGGVIVDRWGYGPVFWVSMVGGLAALVLSLNLKEPRRIQALAQG
jgi:MFS family permease